MIDFVRKFVGYSITGLTAEQKLIICHGSGGNGKTMFLEFIKKTLGNFYATADKSILSTLKPGAPNPSLFRISGARFVSIQETKMGDKFDGDVIKRLTGGDSLTCRGLYKKEIEFKPQWQLWLATNHIPVATNAYSMERRLILIKFNARFVNIDLEKKKEAARRSEKSNSEVNWEEIELPPNFIPIDPHLDQKLNTDEFRESLLSWAVSGAHDYIKDGMTYPKSVLELVKAQMEKCDSVKIFTEEKCMTNPGDDTYKYQSSHLYTAYSNFCKERMLEVKPQDEIIEELTALGFVKRKSHGIIFWFGIKPIPAENEGASLLFPRN